MTQMPDGPAEPATNRPKPFMRDATPAPHPGVLRHGTRRPPRRKPATVRRLTEWHAMTAAERDAAWNQLLAWVTWLHDRYELGIEERLPRCWAEHPGMIEELWALKAWREEIYQADQPSGQAARYWHAELRQTVHAANTFYAAGCRAGHRGADGLAAEDEQLQQRWASADPAAGIPADMLVADEDGASRTDSHLFLTSATMDARRAGGVAESLSRTVTDVVKHDGSWWRRSAEGDGWLRVTDRDVDRTLDQRAAALALADRSVERHTAQRNAARMLDQGSA